MDTNNFTLRNLINLIPLDEITKSDLLALELNMTADEKYRLSKICWMILRLIKREEYRDKVMTTLEGIARGTRKYLPREFDSFEKQIIEGLRQRLVLTSTDSQIQDVKKQLEQFKTKPLSQDKTSPSPATPPAVKPAL